MSGNPQGFPGFSCWAHAPSLIRMAIQDTGFDVQPSIGNHFAWMRTMLALQRTLMAAVRTSVSLIGFGFTVAQFFDKIRDQLPGNMRDLTADTARNLGLVLIGAGVVSLGMFLWQYRSSVDHLKSGDCAILATGDTTLHRSAYLVSLAVILIGIAAFVSIFLRF